MVDQQDAVRIKLFQHGARRQGILFPVSAPVHGGMPEDRAFDGQGVAADGAVLPDIGDGLLLQFRNAGKPAAVFHARLPVGGKVRPVLAGPDGQFLVGIIHQQPVPVEQVAQHFLFKSLHTGLERQLGVPAADVHRVKLDAAGLADILIRTVLSDETVLSEEALPAQDKLPCLFLCDGQHGIPHNNDM